MGVDAWHAGYNMKTLSPITVVLTMASPSISGRFDAEKDKLPAVSQKQSR